jgi:hypothetical protein
MRRLTRDCELAAPLSNDEIVKVCDIDYVRKKLKLFVDCPNSDLMIGFPDFFWKVSFKKLTILSVLGWILSIAN